MKTETPQEWLDGYNAYMNDQAMNTCPHPEGAKRHEWEAGWMCAEDERAEEEDED